MKIKMYVLCLLKFRDGEIVFTNQELDNINNAIAGGLQQQKLFAGANLNSESRGVFKVYSWDLKKVVTCPSVGAKIKSAEIGYYHHRVIVHFILDSAGDFSKLREVRDQLKKLVDRMIEHGVQDQINYLADSGTIKEEAEVEFFYTYPLIVLEKRPKRSESFPFSEDTGSLCFDIVEPSWFPPSGKRHMMRVSIPSTILYPSRCGVGTNLLRDIVNAIYQYCLYEQKSMDVNRNYFENVLDESLQVKLWMHIIDCMGGRPIDIHIIRLTHITYFLALLALVLSIIVPLILR